MKNKFDPKSYIKHPSLVINSGKDNSLISSNGLILSAKLILINWDPLGMQSKDKSDKGKPLGTGLVRVSPMPTPIGKLAPIDFSLDVFHESYVHFLDLGSIEVPYQLSFKNPKEVNKAQITIREYVESDIYSIPSMLNNPSVIA